MLVAMGSHGALLSELQHPTDRGTNVDGEPRLRPCRPGARRAGSERQGYSRDIASGLKAGLDTHLGRMGA